MTFGATRSCFITSLTRYSRSWGLWLMLLLGPIGARFMIARDDGSGVQIAVGHHLPVMTSAMLGVSLGIVVSTLLLPVAFLCLRSNVTRRQPWQIEETTAASRTLTALGRFGADVVILFAMLATLNVAGWLLGWAVISAKFDALLISWTLWLVAPPAVMGLAAIHRLLDAFPPTRRGAGDAVFFCLWLASLVMPITVADRPSDLTTNLSDFAGFIRPLAGPAPSQGQDIVLGSGGIIERGRVPLDVLAGVHAAGYVASRVLWAVIAIVVATVAGLLYRPHTIRRRSRLTAAAAQLFSPGPAPAVVPGAPSAGHAALPIIGLIRGEFRLIGAGRLFKSLAAIAAVAGLAGDYRHLGSPVAMLLLIFGMASHAGRSEALGLLPLTCTTLLSPNLRRMAFIAAGVLWSCLLAVPATLIRISLYPVILSAAAGAIAATVAAALCGVSQSPFAARLVLLILWYAYLSS